MTQELPQGWVWARLEDLQAPEPRALTDGPFGSNLASRHYTDSGARVIRLQNIGDGIFIDEESYISIEHFESLREHEAITGDLVIASLGNELPRAALVPELHNPALVKADCIRMRVHKEVSARWILHALCSPESKAYASEKIRGIGRPRLGLSEIRKIPIPLPPFAEQRRIVLALEEQLSRLKSGHLPLRATSKRLAILLESAIQNELGNVNSSSLPLAKLLKEKIINGRSVADRSGGFPVLKLNAIKEGWVDVNISKEGDWSKDEAHPFLVSAGDFLLCRGNGTLSLVGRGALVHESETSVAFPDTMMRLRVNEDILNTSYFDLVWNSRHIRNQIESEARTTAGIYKINQSILKQIKVPVPSKSEQQAIVSRMHTLSDAVYRLQGELAAAWTQAERLRRSLLSAAFSGRLAPQEPEDEPASVLLERIKAERAAAAPARGRRSRTKNAASASPSAFADPQPVATGEQTALEF